MNLPQPSADALEQSTQMRALLKDRITQAGGWIPFSTYMADAL